MADFLKAHDNLNNKITLYTVNTADELLTEPSFDNNIFRIGGKTLHFNGWIRTGKSAVKS